MILVGVYFLTVILLPWAMGLYAELSAKDLPSIIEFDFRNFNVLMQEEEKWEKKYGPPKSNEDSSEEEIKEFKEIMIKMKKIFKANEDSLRSRTLDKIKTQQTISSLFPTLFYFSTCESSSTGVNSFMDFHSYCQEKKEGFVDFNIDKTFPPKKEGVTIEDESASKKLENFIKGDEDLFFAKPKLPFNFWLGVFLTPFYSVLLLFLSFRIFKKRQKIQEPKISCQITFEKGNVLFIHCENESIKRDIFNHYQNQGNALCFEKFNISHFKFYGIKTRELFKHLCLVSEVDEKKALKNLEHMGIRDLNIFEPDDETILKIYTAVKTNADYELIVLDDFLRKESREFEIHFSRLLLALEKSGKKIIYLSTRSYDISMSLDDEVEIDKFAILPIDLKEVTLR
jgi:hypothetical protein